jgi:hypothetical protein
VIRADLAALFASIVADGVADGTFETQDPAITGTALVGAVSEVLIGPLSAARAPGPGRDALLAELRRLALRAAGARAEMPLGGGR